MVAPTAWFALFFAVGAIPSWGHEILPRLWPSSTLLLLTSGREHSAASYLIVIAAILGNVLLYSLLGAVGYGLRRFLTR